MQTWRSDTTPECSQETAAHGQNCPGEHPPSDPTELPLWGNGSSPECRGVCVTQTDGKKFTYRPRGEAGGQPWDRKPQASWLLEAAWVWLVEAPGGKWHSPPARVPGGRDGDSSWVFSGSDGMSCLQKFIPGSLRIPNVDALTFPSVDVLLHWKVKVGAT